MIGLMVNGKPLVRAYSLVNAPWEEHLEFLSIKVEHVAAHQPTPAHRPRRLGADRQAAWWATLVIGNVARPQASDGEENLWLWATGTGLAPYEHLEDAGRLRALHRVILSHTVRRVAELAYQDEIRALPKDELSAISLVDKLMYYPGGGRAQAFSVGERITTLITNGRIFRDLGLPELHPDRDRVMLCGSEAMNADCRHLLEARGFTEGSSGNRAPICWRRLSSPSNAR